MKPLFTALAIGFISLCSAGNVPVEWTADVDSLAVHEFAARRGETLEFAVKLTYHGKPFAPEGDWDIFYQTNGMGSAYFTFPVAVEGNVARVTFTPAMDPGAERLVGFIGRRGVNYRAAFALRFYGSPGAMPNALTLPTKTIDFAQLEVHNAPWITAADLDDKRDKTDLTVYKADHTARVAAECFPIVIYGETITSERVRLDQIDPGGDYHLGIGNYAGYCSFSADGFFAYGDSSVTYGGRKPVVGEWPRLEFMATITPTADTLAKKSEVNELTGYARAVYDYMHGNTNAWFSGTNYPDKATAAHKYKFQFEPGMDLLSVPCSMALMEIRDGEKQTVWDQRDWPAWYWSFKSAQLRDEIAEMGGAIYAAIAAVSNSMPSRAWGGYTARGLENPDPKTTWVDTERVVLAAGFAWENVTEVNGCAYWTIVGDGAVLSGDETSGVLEIKDFEGKSVMRIVKGEHDFKPVLREDFAGQGRDSSGRATFDIRSNVQPVGAYSTVLDDSTFISENDSACPVNYEWEDRGNGVWRIHFILKDGIDSSYCFAKFTVAVNRDTTIEYSTAPTISGGLIYDGVKIRPVISGKSVSWEVVE